MFVRHGPPDRVIIIRDSVIRVGRSLMMSNYSVIRVGRSLMMSNYSVIRVGRSLMMSNSANWEGALPRRRAGLPSRRC